ncbi:MAG: hypothetical protein J6V10_09375, partial [Clostridia bacterium]|nr:hypothetical protein [Clostridia bacterium]
MKRNNQTIIITLLFAFLLSGLLMASCDRTHVHSFGEWTVTKSPTCVVVGEKERICVCGFKETQLIDITDHVVVIDFETVATCTSEGKTEG